MQLASLNFQYFLRMSTSSTFTARTRKNKLLEVDYKNVMDVIDCNASDYDGADENDSDEDGGDGQPSRQRLQQSLSQVRYSLHG